VGVGLKLMNAPDGVGVFWAGHRHALRLPAVVSARYWLSLLAFGFLGRDPVQRAFAPPLIPYTMAGLLYFVKFGAGVAGVLLVSPEHPPRPDFLRAPAPRAWVCGIGRGIDPGLARWWR
jgi:hypothetical protein